MRLVWGTVVSILSEHPGVQRLEVEAEGIDLGGAEALSYPALTGSCAAGQRVLLNTTAVDLGLGTGGAHFVVARNSGRAVELDRSSGGHVMKLRYSPLQVDVLASEEEAAPGHAAMQHAESLGGMPVVCCGLHSQIAHAAAGVRTIWRGARVVYVMTDAASLPLPLSNLARELSDAALLDGTVSCGQAFGGELEAVNLHSGLLAARHLLQADVAIVANGPGGTGTDTPFGHGGVAQGESVNAVGALGGRPVAVLRISFADPRPRHYGVSHHTLVALARIALARAKVPVPTLPSDLSRTVDTVLDDAGVWVRHERVSSAIGPDLLPDTRGVSVRTMGRSIADDPAFFAAAAAAGDVAARLLS